MRGLAKGEPNLKILVLSDSHRCVGAMYDAAMLEKPDVIFHLGDHVSDAQELSYALDPIDFYEVRGNCDFGAQAPETILMIFILFRIWNFTTIRIWLPALNGSARHAVPFWLWKM